MNSSPDLAFWLRTTGELAAQSAIVLALAATAARLAGSAAWRRASWQAGFLAVAMLVPLTLSGVGRRVAPPTLPTDRSESRFVVRGNLPVTATVAPANAAAPSAPTRPATAAGASGCWWPGWIWLAGAVLLVARGAACRLALAVAGNHRRQVTDADLLRRVESIRLRLGWKHSVRVLEFAGLQSPIAFGIWRPALGLPRDFARNFPVAQQDAMLAHELAHLAARDPLWQDLGELVTAALWWHPLLWWARRQWRVACEFAADEASLLVDGGPTSLAECLVALGRELPARRAWGWLGIEGGGYRSGLGRRVQRLLQLQTAAWSPTSGRRTLALAVGACAVAGLTVATANLTVSAAPNSPPLALVLRESWAASNRHPATAQATKASSLAAAAPESSRAGTKPEEFLVRAYKVDSNAFLGALRRTSPDSFPEGNTSRDAAAGGLPAANASPTNTPKSAPAIQKALRDFFSRLGIDLSPASGKTVFFNDQQGLLLVRAPARDQATVESAILFLNSTPPQVNLKVRFIEVTADDAQALGFDWFLGNVAMGGAPGTSAPPASGVFPGAATPGSPIRPVTANEFQELRGDALDWEGRHLTNARNIRVSAALKANGTGILTESQCQVLLRALTNRSGVEILSAPQVVTLSDRQAQVRVAEVRTIMTGPDPRAPKGTAPLPETIELGPMADLMPTVLADGYTVELGVTVRVTEFLGYDLPPAANSGYLSPTPHLRVRQMVSRARVFDGQTLILVGPAVEAVRDSHAPAAANGPALRKRLLVLLTPTIVDPAGNRLHTDDEMPFARQAVPPQK